MCRFLRDLAREVLAHQSGMPRGRFCASKEADTGCVRPYVPPASQLHACLSHLVCDTCPVQCTWGGALDVTPTHTVSEKATSTGLVLACTARAWGTHQAAFTTRRMARHARSPVAAPTQRLHAHTRTPTRAGLPSAQQLCKPQHAQSTHAAHERPPQAPTCMGSPSMAAWAAMYA